MSGITITPRTVRHIEIATGRPYEKFREEYETAVPAFDRLEAIGVVTSGAGWAGIESLSRNTAVHGLVSFFTFDPSPVMRLNGSTRSGVTYLSGNIVFPGPEMTEVAAVFTRTFGQLLQHLGLPVPREITGTDGDE